jgi:hypothetical protein
MNATLAKAGFRAGRAVAIGLGVFLGVVAVLFLAYLFLP